MLDQSAQNPTPLESDSLAAAPDAKPPAPTAKSTPTAVAHPAGGGSVEGLSMIEMLAACSKTGGAKAAPQRQPVLETTENPFTAGGGGVGVEGSAGTGAELERPGTPTRLDRQVGFKSISTHQICQPCRIYHPELSVSTYLQRLYLPGAVGIPNLSGLHAERWRCIIFSPKVTQPLDGSLHVITRGEWTTVCTLSSGVPRFPISRSANRRRSA